MCVVRNVRFMTKSFPCNEAQVKELGETRSFGSGIGGSRNQWPVEGSSACHWILALSVWKDKTKRCGWDRVFLENWKDGFVIALFHEDETERTRG